MNKDWLAAGETLLGDWAAYIGEPSPTSPKVTGRLCVTDRRVVFAAGLRLEENAGAEVLRRRQAFAASDQQRSFAYEEIGGVEALRKKLILRSLQLTLRSGERVEFQFGAASPARALELIRERCGR
jgi:hypothetical protein